MINVLPYEQKYGLPQGMLNAVMQTESSGNPNAVSPKGAQGLFQFMPETAKELGIDPLVPEQAADGAARYLKQHYDRFGDWNLALAAYNAGPGNVQKYGGIPPFQETQQYVQKVSSQMAQPTQQNNTQVTASDWRSRAAPVVRQDTSVAPPKSDWRSRAQPIKVEEPAKQVPIGQGPGSFIDNSKKAYAARDQQMVEAADRYVAGEQGLAKTLTQTALANASKVPDTIGAALSSVTPQGVKNLASKVVTAAGNLPVPDGKGGTLASTIPGEVQALENTFPQTMDALKMGGQAANIALSVPAIGTAGRALDTVGDKLAQGARRTKVALNERAAALPNEPSMPNQADFKKMANQDYDLSEYLGAKFSPKDVSDKIESELSKVAPKPLANGKFTKEDQVFIDNLADYQGLAGKELTLADIKRLDEAIGQKITQKFVDPRTGMPDANGLKLQKFQQKIRQLVDETDAAGNDALVNGRNAWKTQTILSDLDTIAERASMTQNPAQSMQVGYKNLYFDKDRIRGWPKEAVDLLKKAGTPGIGAEALSLITSRLPAAIMGGTGNFAGAATAQVAGMAARGAREAVVAGRGAKVQQAVVADALNKRRSVDVPEPKPDAPLRLAPPDKMSALPMTDRQVGIAQQLMRRAPGNVSQGEGVIAPPVSRLTSLIDSLPNGRNNAQLNDMIERFKSGSLSQNKFVIEATEKFDLTPTQARQLAKEVERYDEGVGETPEPMSKTARKQLENNKPKPPTNRMTRGRRRRNNN